MVNHFATLLINSNIFSIDALRQNYLLADNTNALLTAEESLFTYNIALNDYYTELVKSAEFSFFINKHFSKIALPPQLQKLYNILFPKEASFHFRHFLLYSYLRLVASTDMTDDTYLQDKRISYDLDDFSDYFKFYKIYTPKISANNYQLIVQGRLDTKEESEDFNNNFLIRQIADTTQLAVFSTTQKEYYKEGKAASSSAAGMSTTISAVNDNLSSTVIIGETGLSFKLTGAMNAFTASPNKFWTFMAQAPFNFDFSDKLSLLEKNYQIVEDMFSFESGKCNVKYENIWKTHYNSVYKFAGLLMGYVERVNLVWLEG